MDKIRNPKPSTNEANLGQKEAETEKREMPTRDETKDANLGQKEAELEKAELADENEEGLAEDDDE
jgi:hypothetical protein